MVTRLLLQSAMSTLEKVVLHQVHDLRAAESMLESKLPQLPQSSNEQIERFVEGLLELQQRASRLERLIEAMAA
jgi:ferritin-like metal-binding protein YciE